MGSPADDAQLRAGGPCERGWTTDARRRRRHVNERQVQQRRQRKCPPPDLALPEAVLEPGVVSGATVVEGGAVVGLVWVL
eukprot:CAMPEP_0202843340 /NCGR_PEP_ID=MMETSP1389-20130828/64002_1 /ASSEMBLY_ACC=CAM_ASM_000865 /TAXON_ID=302021 /ORGANISM="Rhodomonas sp., Strain CCMP768" /LENGTH=79 /DNA_ID=CAMNT_0049520473 /DNA_START=115 /DNA_END=352 /DNA_ORIENTATION=+